MLSSSKTSPSPPGTRVVGEGSHGRLPLHGVARGGRLAGLLALALGALAFALMPAAAPAAPQAVGREQLPPGLKVETFAGPLSGPVALAFLPDGRLLITEKHGALRIVDAGGLRAQPLLELPTDQRAERGLLGVAVDPHFDSTGWVYLFHSLPAPPVNRIVRFRLAGDGAVDVQAVYTVTTTSNIHNGGNLHFGPDGMLYVGVGEGGQPAVARDPRDRRGKILRLSTTTTPLSPAPGNPYAELPGFDAAVWAVGLRNPFDFTFDPISRALYATDNGPDCNDELNRVRPARDYGWRTDYACGRPQGAAGTEPPMWVWPDTIGVAGPAVYSGARIPDWEGSLLVCGWNDGTLFRAQLSRDRARVERMNQVLGITCNIDITIGPDGTVYYIEGGGYIPGNIRRIVPDPDATPGPRPTLEPPPVGFPAPAGTVGSAGSWPHRRQGEADGEADMLCRPPIKAPRLTASPSWSASACPSQSRSEKQPLWTFRRQGLAWPSRPASACRAPKSAAFRVYSAAWASVAAVGIRSAWRVARSGSAGASPWWPNARASVSAGDPASCSGDPVDRASAWEVSQPGEGSGRRNWAWRSARGCGSVWDR